MKKILALILAALMVLTMFACAAKTEPAKEAEQTTTTEPAEETTPEETAPAAEETTEEPAVGGTISVFATSYTDAKLEVFQEIIMTSWLRPAFRSISSPRGPRVKRSSRP